MKRIISAVSVLALLLSAAACGSGSSKPKILIYTSAEEFRVEHMEKRFKEEFPDYDIVIEYMTSGNHGAKLLAEGTDTECDITHDLEYSYMYKLKDSFADLSGYDFSQYMEEVADPDKKFLPELRNGGCIVVNTEVLKQKGLSEPKSYKDLLKPEYKGLISMPSPKSSGTGYMFLKNLVNVWGEQAAFDYFDKLSENILQFTSSGSGPVNALIQGEAAIGLAMTGQTVTEINKGQPLKIIFFEEGSPYSLYGFAMIKGKEERKEVKEVFDFIVNVLNVEDKELFYPEKIYKNRDFKITGFPENIKYADMSSNTSEEKDRLLEKWKY